MGLFKKREKVPEIPPIPTLPELPALPRREINELPSIPDISIGENINREMVKSAVNDSSEEKEGVEELPRDFHFQEEPLEKRKEVLSIPPSKPREKKTLEIQPGPSQIPKPPRFEKMIESQPSQTSEEPSYFKDFKSTKPVFVRIDKFREAQMSFEEIKRDLHEAEMILNQVKEIKLKEDAEISEWIKDLEKIKERLSEIDSNIFSRL